MIPMIRTLALLCARESLAMINILALKRVITPLHFVALTLVLFSVQSRIASPTAARTMRLD